MAFQLGHEDYQPINEMNLIPLIDIMLVLMIIFLVTATVVNPSIPLDLPNTSAHVDADPTDILHISIDKDAGIFLDNQAMTLEQLAQYFSDQVKAGKNPTLQLRADKDSKYDTVAQVLAAASAARLNKIAFITDK